MKFLIKIPRVIIDARASPQVKFQYRLHTYIQIIYFAEKL
jgi:hypothetical protein